MLSVAPVLGHLLSMVCKAQEFCIPCVESMLAALHVLELLVATRSVFIDPDLLHSAIKRHASLYVAAYDEEHMRPKHHYVFHLSAQYKRFGRLISCFVHERHHKLLKKYALPRRNTKSYETGLIEEATVHQLMAAELDFTAVGFQYPVHPKPLVLSALKELFPNEQHFVVSKAYKTAMGSSIHVGDFVLGNCDGELSGCSIRTFFRAEGGEYAVVAVWNRQPAPHEHMARFRRTEAINVVEATTLLTSVIHTCSPESGTAVALIPYEHRKG